MPPSQEVQLALLGQQMEQMSKAMERMENHQATVAERMTEYASGQDKMNQKMTVIEAQLASNQPTIQEFVTIKHKVQGAGAAGKWIWAAAAGILTFIATNRNNIIDFFQK